MKKQKQRNEIDRHYQWDLSSMFKDENEWDADLKKALAKAQEFTGFRGKLTESADTLLAAFRLHDEMWQTLEKVFVYAHMKKDEDNRVESAQAMDDKAGSAIAQMAAAASFAVPELLEADEQQLMGYLDEKPELEVYRFYLTNVLREKAHVLSQAEENILAQLSEVTSAPHEIFTMLNNAEMDFGTIKDEEGNEVPLTHGNYITFMQSHDRSVRENAYNGMYNAFRRLINTISTAYNYSVKRDVISARIRNYPSARDAALFGDNVPGSVYDHLVRIVNETLPVLHRYIEIRKKLLGVEELKMHDVYVPLIKMPKKTVSYEDALELINKALQPMGAEYLSYMNNGFHDGWVDVYENEGKTSGAYSFGSYDSKPYILCNYSDTLEDVFTIIHEMGHSMHSFYTRANQPFIYGSHSIFTAEVASTVNETLLMKYLAATEEDPEMKKYLLNMHIEAFRTTLFRQTMFAEFEDLTHKAVEAGETLTAGWLCEKYDELNTKYFGPAISADDLIRYEWARIPHFYRAFYVYKYATGYSAASAISDIILEKGSADYIEFLKTGDSDYPIELLKIAGVDMSQPEPIERAMQVFSGLVDEFERLV